MVLCVKLDVSISHALYLYACDCWNNTFRQCPETLLAQQSLLVLRSTLNELGLEMSVIGDDRLEYGRWWSIMVNVSFCISVLRLEEPDAVH